MKTPDRSSDKSLLPRCATIALATVIGVFFLYSVAALLGVGRGLLFPSTSGVGPGLPTLRFIGDRLKASMSPCGRRGPEVLREASAGRGVQTVSVDVKDHFSPNVIVARRHIPLRIEFRRYYEGPCSDRLEIPAFRIRRALLVGSTTSIVIFPSRPGRFTFSCALGMMTGTIVIR